MNPNEPAAGAVATAATINLKRRLGFLRKIPFTFFAGIVFVILKLSVEDVRAAYQVWGPYSMTPVEIFDLLLAMATSLELLRVSHPGIDNTSEVHRMALVAVASIIVLVLSMTEISMLHIFNNTEFLAFCLLATCQAVVASYINSRTLKRSMGVDVGSS